MHSWARRSAWWVMVSLFAASAAEGQQSPAADSGRTDSLARFRMRPIEVTVTRGESELRRLSQAVEVVTRAQIGPGRAELGLDEALFAVPGVIAANRQNYSLDQLLSIRGFGARSAFGVRGLKVLLDGIPQTLPDGQGQLTNVDLDDVERIEVLRGSSSSLYGNASGGVISLWTGAAVRPVRFAPDARVLGGAFGLTKYRGAVEAPVGRGSVSLSGARTMITGFRAHSGADLRQGRLRAALPLGATSLTLVVQAADDPNTKDPGALTRAEMDADPTLANPLSVTRDAGKSVSQEQAGFAATRRLPGGGRLEATIFGLKRDLTNPTTATYIELGRWAYGARTGASLPLRPAGREATVTAGFDAQWQRDNRTNRNVQRTALTRDQLEQVSELGPFARVTLAPSARVTLNLGARYDRVRFRVDDRFLSDGDDSGTRIMSAASGSSGVALEIAPGLAPYLSVGTSFETPTTTELANRPTGPGGFNPDLGPQRAVNYELGVRGRLPAGVEYSAAGYRANVRGELIPFEVPGDPGRRFFRNAGSSRHEGVEVGGGAGPVGGLMLRAAYTYSRHRFLDYRTSTAVLDGKDVPGVPRHYLKASLTYRTGRGGWVAIEEVVSSSYYVDDANTVRTPGWSAAGVRAGMEIRAAGWRISPFGGLGNLFDARYAGSVQVNASGGRYFEPAPGRNAYVGLEVGAARS